MLFKPSLIGKNGVPGLDQVISEVLSKINKHMRLQFLNIHVTGGSALFPGMKERLERDIQTGMSLPAVVYTPKDTLENWKEGYTFYWQHYYSKDAK